MSFKMSRSAYQKLIDEDIAWLMEQPRTLERDHIVQILRHSVETYYEPERKGGGLLLDRSDVAKLSLGRARPYDGTPGDGNRRRK
jgi:hypothetical protein